MRRRCSCSTITRRYFEQLAPVEDDDTAKWMRALRQPERADLAAKRLSDMNPMWNSMLRDTITPTELQRRRARQRDSLGGAAPT